MIKRGMTRPLAFLLVLVVLLSCCASALAEELAFTGVVKGGKLNLRATPSSGGKLVTTIKAGTTVKVLENDGVWCKIEYGGKTGYASAEYLNIKPTYPHIGWAVTPQDGKILNVYAQASTSSAVVYKCLDGVHLELVEKQNGWYRVQVQGVFGYVESGSVTPLDGKPSFAVLTQYPDMLPSHMTGLDRAGRDWGIPYVMEKNDEAFSYTIQYPLSGGSEADGLIIDWTRSIADSFNADFSAHHSASKASMTIDYSAASPDGRYAAVVMYGTYCCNDLPQNVELLYTMNVDTQTGKVLHGKQLFNNLNRILFVLEYKMRDVFNLEADGYTTKPTADWLDNAVLGKNGVEVYLPAGQYLPPALGTQKVVLPYREVIDCLDIDSSLKEAFARVIDPSLPMVALTFDDGPSKDTERILALLDLYDGRATFCVVGVQVEQYGNVLKHISIQGSEIACHTWGHKKLTELSKDKVKSQITQLNKLVYELTGDTIKVLRPPYGSVNKTVRAVCADLDMIIAQWEIDTLDWSTRSATKTYNAIMKDVHNGTIILCHDLYSTTADAMEKVIPELAAKGYQLVTVSELLSFHKDGTEPGMVYSRIDPANIDTTKR